MRKSTKPKNSIIYSGPSLIDGSPIVCIAIVSSGNTKTGNMVQTHILRADINPLEASKTGLDYAICGNCKHRGKPTEDATKKQAIERSCYVNLGQGPNVVFKAFKRGVYPIVTDSETIKTLGHGRMVRLGTYGDPSAIPSSVWDALLADSIGHTGYSHQHDINKPEIYTRAMYSADSPSDAIQAHSKGYRTFRVIPVNEWQTKGNASLLNNEILCPASIEAGRKAQCIDCKLCAGNKTKAKSIAIVAHGATRNKA